MNDLLFDEATHTYTRDGVEVPSVTTVISGVWPELYDWSTDYAMERGSKVHKAIALDFEGDLDEDSLSPILVPYLHAARRFLLESGFSTEHDGCERRLYSPTYGYAGTLDRLGILGGKRTIVDFKTGDPGWATGLQTAAYAHAIQEETGVPVRRRFGCRLKPDATYTLIEYPNYRDDLDLFVAALKVYRRKAA